MEKYNCIIVEDEPLAAEVLEDYIRQTPFLELRGVCTDAILALDLLQKEKSDLIFLDIHLPKLKGFEFIRSLKKIPNIIVTTAYREYAVEGFELNVLDYLVKPISFDRFLTAVNKMRQAGSTDRLPSAERPYIFINVNKKMVKIWIDEILYIESRKEYVNVVLKDRSYLTKIPLTEVEEKLAGNNFIRVHRSFLISKIKIEAFTATEIEIGGIQIPIGRSYKDFVNELPGEKL